MSTIIVGGSFALNFILFYFLFYPNEFKKTASILLDVLSKFWKEADYLSTKYELEGKVNSFVRNLEANTTSQFPDVTIKWTGQKNEEIAWEDGRVVLVMRDRNHKNKNFVHAVYFFTSETLLGKLKRHLSKTQKTSLDLFATKKLIQKESAAAVEQFMNDYFIPHMEKQEDLSEMIKKYLNIDALGVFFPILIQELSSLGNKVFLVKPDSEIIKEVKSLIDFLYDFSEREVGEESASDNTFIGKYMRCAIKIVASRAVRERGNIKSHKERILKSVQLGVENIYVIGSDEKGNRRFIEEVCEQACRENKQIEIIRSYSFSGTIKIHGERKKVKTFLMCIHNPNAVKYLYEQSDIDSFTEN